VEEGVVGEYVVVFQGRSVAVDELRRQVLAELTAGTDVDRGALYRDLCSSLGTGEASRIWLQAFAAFDASET
jgi:hypothetical protein